MIFWALCKYSTSISFILLPGFDSKIKIRIHVSYALLYPSSFVFQIILGAENMGIGSKVKVTSLYHQTPSNWKKWEVERWKNPAPQKIKPTALKTNCCLQAASVFNPLEYSTVGFLIYNWPSAAMPIQFVRQKTVI